MCTCAADADHLGLWPHLPFFFLSHLMSFACERKCQRQAPGHCWVSWDPGSLSLGGRPCELWLTELLILGKWLLSSRAALK